MKTERERNMPDWFWPKSKAETGVVIRIGRVLHWAGCAAAALLLAVIGLAILFGQLDMDFSDFASATLMVIGLSGAGRLARYVLAGE